MTTLTGYLVRGGTFGAYMGVLRRQGLIDEDADSARVTDASYAAAGAPTADPADAPSAIDKWCRRLRRGEAI